MHHQGYRPLDAISEESWEDTDDDVFLPKRNSEHPSDVITEDVRHDRRKNQNDMGKWDNELGAEDNRSTFINERRLCTTRGIRKDSNPENANHLADGNCILAREREAATKWQKALSKLFNISWQLGFKKNSEVNNFDDDDDMTREAKGVKRTVGCLQEGDTDEGKQMTKFLEDRGEDCDKCLTDEEIVERYRERNKHRRWSQPCWKMRLEDAEVEGASQQETDQENNYDDKTTGFKGKIKNVENSQGVDFANKEGQRTAEPHSSEINKKTMTDKSNESDRFKDTRFMTERAGEIEIKYFRESVNLLRHPSDKLSENLELHLNGKENEDMKDSSKELKQQLSGGKRKPIPTTSIESSPDCSDDNLSSPSRQADKCKMEIGEHYGKQQTNPIIYFNYGDNSAKNPMDFDIKSGSTKREGNRDRDTTSKQYVDNPNFICNEEDFDNYVITDDSQYNGSKSRDVLTSKTDEMLQG